MRLAPLVLLVAILSGCGSAAVEVAQTEPSLREPAIGTGVDLVMRQESTNPTDVGPALLIVETPVRIERLTDTADGAARYRWRRGETRLLDSIGGGMPQDLAAREPLLDILRSQLAPTFEIWEGVAFELLYDAEQGYAGLGNFEQVRETARASFEQINATRVAAGLSAGWSPQMIERLLERDTLELVIAKEAVAFLAFLNVGELQVGESTASVVENPSFMGFGPLDLQLTLRLREAADGEAGDVVLEVGDATFEPEQFAEWYDAYARSRQRQVREEEVRELANRVVFENDSKWHFADGDGWPLLAETASSAQMPGEAPGRREVVRYRRADATGPIDDGDE